MSGRVVLLLLGMFCCARYVIGFESLSEHEDIEVQRILEFHRKPVVTVIKTRYGEEYNCINFYEQPAFDHPKLRNRTFEFKMSPNSTPSQNLWAAKIWANGKGCPSGTVPIKRYTKDDLIKAIRITKIHALNLKISQGTSTNDASSQYYRAVAKNNVTFSDRIFHGIVMHPSLYNPTVDDNEYSSAMMRVSAGLNLIQTGVMVNPSLFSDHRTRLFVYTYVDETNSCFNDVCPGFVIDGQIPLGFPYEPSVIGGMSYDTAFSISREQSSGKWVLKIGQKESNMQVGYWPKDIFTEAGLREPATDAQWGGEVFSKSGGTPAMGSGYKEFIENSTYTAFISGIKFQNKNGELESPLLDQIGTSADSPYKIGTLFKTAIDGVTFFYGGPY